MVGARLPFHFLLAFVMVIVARVAGQEVQGVRFDFQDVELRLVISALADAGGFNVVYSDLPPRRVTLRMNQSVPRDKILGLLHSIAAANGLSVVEEGALLRIAAGPVGVTSTSSHDTIPTTDLRLFVYRLKHARASKLAATLQALFGGRQAYAEGGESDQSTLSETLRDYQVPPTAVNGQPPKVTVDVTPPSSGLPGRLKGFVQIVPDEVTNSLLVRAQPGDWEIVRKAVESLDLRPLQVLIEVLIAEVRKTRDFEAGVTAQLEHKPSGDSGTTIGVTLQGRTPGDFALEVMRVGRFSADVVLSALASQGEVRILSRPVVLAQNNQEARILIGSERPFIQVFRSLPTDGAVRDQVVQYRDVGTSLSIVPTINEDGYVNLQIVQQVSSATAETQFGAPVISTRESATHLFARNGQTIMIGGLIDRQLERAKTGVPLLKDIPLLGTLFGSTSSSTARSELFVFMTPHIIATDEDADRLRQGIEDHSEFLKQHLGENPGLQPPSRQPPDTTRHP